MMIRFENVSLSFAGKSLFQQINFQVNAQDKLIIGGKSGIGKSSLFHLLLGFKIPTGGKIFFEENLLSPSIVNQVREKIAYIPQGANIGRGKAGDTIATILKFKANRHLSLTDNKLQDYFDLFEMSSDMITKPLEQLSGGERQRLSIIIALLLKRDIFLLDEITSAVDTELKKKIISYFMSLKYATVLFISHDPIENQDAIFYDLEKNVWKP